jgi:transposase
MIVALARKLLIALWRFVTTGETLDGVILRPAGWHRVSRDRSRRH